MIQRVSIGDIELPRLYIAENKTDAVICKERGLPFIRWKDGMESLVKIILRPTLEKMFPDIIWNKVLGRKKTCDTQVVIADDGTEAIVDIDDVMNCDLDKHAETDDDAGYDQCLSPIATEERQIGSNGADVREKMLSIEEYVGDLSSSVNLDILQSLSMLPKFMGDIVDCIKVNIGNNMCWTEGYNKKLGVPIGNFKRQYQLKNLIILDVSASIPRGISATMLSLIDTMRTQVNADLIITGAISKFYGIDDELPTPQQLRDEIKPCNETAMFYKILIEHIDNHEWGHVISFGDYDCPGKLCRIQNHWNFEHMMHNCKVHHVHHYHTSREDKTGYANWVHEMNPDVEVSYDTSWCEMIRRW